MQPNQTFFQKNKKEVILTSIALIVFILVGYFLFLNKKEAPSISSNAELKQNSTFFNNLFSNVENIFSSKEENTQEESTIQDNFYRESLIKIWIEPVAGYGFNYYKNNFNYIDEKGETQSNSEVLSKIIFVDSKTGYIYEKDLFAPTTTPRQITNSEYPNVVRAYFMNDNKGSTSRVLVQYATENGTIKTISANIPDYFGVPSKLLNITEMPNNITNITLSPDSQKAFYIVKKTRASDDYYTDWYLINNEEDTYGKRVFSSEMSSWKGILSDAKDIFVYTPSTAYEQNTLYKLESDSTLSQIYSGRTGTGFSVDNKSILLSIFTGSGLKTFLNQAFNKEAFSDNNLITLGFNTLSEKCTMSSSIAICGVPKEIKNYDSGLPDAWYQGFTTWKDDLYVVNEEYPYGALLFDFKVDGEVYDVIDSRDLKINNLLTHLIFINKNDGSLWSLNINNILLPEEVLGGE